MIMATVLLAGIKIANVMLDLSAVKTVLLVSVITVVYSGLGGLKGVVLTDFFQFILSMVGMVIAAIYIISMPEIGGLDGLVHHENVVGKLNFIPDFNDPEVYVPLLIIPLAVQWWSVWYPGAEPGGGGYVAQRMLSARNEKDAVKATLLFNIAHYALRPWPWILIALASLVVFPDLASIQNAFPNVDPDLVKNDLAFPAMLSKLPTGLIGLIIAALMAALMSTISTHLNWGSSYVVKDFVVRFFNPDLGEKTQVNIGRLSTLILMVLAAAMALILENALQAFNILLQIGAGTGLLFILRWFWWRINAYSEIVAMVVSFVVACYFELFYQGDLLSYERMLIGVVVTTISWVAATLLSRPTDMDVLTSFYLKIKPHPLAWKPVLNALTRSGMDFKRQDTSSLAMQILAMFASCLMVYCLLFGIGSYLYGGHIRALIFILVSLALMYWIYKLLKGDRIVEA